MVDVAFFVPGCVYEEKVFYIRFLAWSGEELWVSKNLTNRTIWCIDETVFAGAFFQGDGAFPKFGGKVSRFLALSDSGS